MITFQQFRSDKFSWLIFLKDMQCFMSSWPNFKAFANRTLHTDPLFLSVKYMLIDSPVHTLMTFVGKHLHVFVYFYIKFRF